jgi:GTPase involved in cell partitioning and DNA repair
MYVCIYTGAEKSNGLGKGFLKHMQLSVYCNPQPLFKR